MSSAIPSLCGLPHQGRGEEVNTWGHGNLAPWFRARMWRLPAFTELGKKGDSNENRKA